MSPALRTLIFAAAVNRIGTMVVPFLSLYLTKHRGWSDADAAGVVMTYGIGTIGGFPLGGWIADRFGRRSALILGFATSSALMLLIPAVSDGVAFFALVFALAVTAEMIRPPTNAAVADLTTPENRAKAYGAYRTAMNLGFGVASVLGAFLSGWNIRALFWVDAATGFAAAFLVARRLPETRPIAPAPGSKEALAEPAPGAAFVAFCALAFATYVVPAQFTTTFPLSIQDRADVPSIREFGGAERLYGLALACNGFVVVLAQQLWTRVFGRLSSTGALALGSVLYGAGFGLASLPLSPIVVFASVAVFTFGEMTFVPSTAIYVAETAPVAARGRLLGVAAMMYGIAKAFAPIVGVRAMARFGHAAFWLAMPVIGLIAAGGFLALGASVRRRAQAPTTTAPSIDVDPTCLPDAATD